MKDAKKESDAARTEAEQVARERRAKQAEEKNKVRKNGAPDVDRAKPNSDAQGATDVSKKKTDVEVDPEELERRRKRMERFATTKPDA